MLERLLELRPAIEALKDGNINYRHEEVMLSPEEWRHVRHLEALLRPCKEVSDMLEGEKYPTHNFTLLNLVCTFLLYKGVVEEGEYSALTFVVRPGGAEANARMTGEEMILDEDHTATTSADKEQTLVYRFCSTMVPTDVYSHKSS